MRSALCGTKYFWLLGTWSPPADLRFFTLTKCSTGLRLFLRQEAARKSSTVMPSRR